MKEIEVKTWLADQGKQSVEIQRLVISLVEQQKATVAPSASTKSPSP